ncbi:DoxX family protein [Jiangella mangrovi]|uniref:Putative membrane protein YphA (DoxX/SURF4 family) n=1 Tax=Jiangella mangrovi TaxID=1524084 RepID=A0A7W9LJ54_9ACTN|nr:DoxX family protein [Jiangella mangrovi]MBB5785725.1 putative membrane protein YphA (DoxX/SURF4 family) [Jiangella mangrovi]
MSITTATAVPAATAGGRTRRRAASIALWCVQVFLAAQFVVAGTLKAAGDPQMVELFAEIGAGQWFRYVIAAIELAGALGVLVPRLAGAAALGLAGLMTGAVLTTMVLVHTSPALPIVFLLLAAGVAVARRREIAR